ncbi:MAG: serine hydrolase domain-containing protein [Polyangiaceae bacterium]
MSSSNHRWTTTILLGSLAIAGANGACGSDVSSGTGASGEGGTTTGISSTGGSDEGGGNAGGGGMAPDPCLPLEPGLRAALETAYAPDANLKGGLMLAVSTPDCPLWSASVGDDMLTADSLFKIGVTSRMLVAATVLTLVDDGVLSLDDTLDAWIPAIPDSDTLTLQHLLNATSGLRDYNENQDFLDLLSLDPDTVWTPNELIQYSIDAGQAAPPGTAYDRKFVDFVALGIVLEAVTGLTAHAAIRDRVIDPLGLDATFLAGPEGSFAKIVPGYLPNGMEFPKEYVDPSFWWVGAAFVSNAVDTLALSRAIVVSDLLSETSRDALLDLTVPTGAAGLDQGLGVLADTSSGDLWVGQQGTIPPHEVRNFYSPALDAAVVVLGTNDFATYGLLVDAFGVIDDAQSQ